MTWFVSCRTKRLRRVLTAVIAPFLGLFSLYFTALILGIIVSLLVGIDMGIGDSWYVPVTNTTNLSFIDTRDKGDLVCKYKNIPYVCDVTHLAQSGETVYGQVADSTYFVYDAETYDLRCFDSETEFDAYTSGANIELQSASSFYSSRVWQLAGVALILVAIFSIAVSLLLLFMLRYLLKLIFVNREQRLESSI